MIKVSCALLIGLLTLSCGSTKVLKVKEVNSLYFEYNPDFPLNFGSDFQGKIIARTLNGKEIDVSDHKKFELESTDIMQKDKNLFSIVKHPL